MGNAVDTWYQHLECCEDEMSTVQRLIAPHRELLTVATLTRDDVVILGTSAVAWLQGEVAVPAGSAAAPAGGAAGGGQAQPAGAGALPVAATGENLAL